MSIKLSKLEARAVAIAYNEYKEGLVKISLEGICRKLFPVFKEDRIFYENYQGK